MQGSEKYKEIIHEKEYTEKMRTTVLPYLSARCRDTWIPCIQGKEKEKRIHVKRYLADQPQGVVVISHGFSESARKYQEIIYYVLREGYHVYIPEHC